LGTGRRFQLSIFGKLNVDKKHYTNTILDF
jgi:hypothetical protein